MHSRVCVLSSVDSSFSLNSELIYKQPISWAVVYIVALMSPCVSLCVFRFIFCLCVCVCETLVGRWIIFIIVHSHFSKRLNRFCHVQSFVPNSLLCECAWAKLFRSPTLSVSVSVSVFRSDLFCHHFPIYCISMNLFAFHHTIFTLDISINNFFLFFFPIQVYIM